MPTLSHTLLTVTLFSSVLLFTACSSSSVHPYNETYGLIPNPEVDRILAEEAKAQLITETEVESVELDDPTLSTELIPDPDAVTAENYVQKPTVYTYKYDFDPNFYEEAIWKKQ